MADDYVFNNVNDTWSRYRNIVGVPSRRRIIFAAACLVFVFTLIVIAFAIMNSQDNSKISRLSYPSFQSALNISVDPCVDFYNFTCGLWTQVSHIPEYQEQATAFSLLQSYINKRVKSIFKNSTPNSDFPRVVNNALHFYNSCITPKNTNNSDIELLLQIFDEVGGWPILSKSKWDETTFDLLDYSAFLIKHFDLHVAVSVHTIDNDINKGKNVIFLKPPSLLREDELNDMIFNQMIYAILHSLNNSYIHPDVLDDIEDIKLTLTKWKEMLSVPYKEINPIYMTVEKLSQEIPEVDWLKYLQLITNDTLLKLNETLTLNDVVAIDNVNFLKKVATVVTSSNFTKEELANLFGWFAFKNIWILIPGVLQTYAESNSYDSNEIKGAASSVCYDLVLELFPNSLDYLFVQNTSSVSIRDGVVLTTYLKSAYRNVIQKSDWLDDETKSLLLQRLTNMKNVIGFPSYLNNKTEFNKVYNKFPDTFEYDLAFYFQIKQYYVEQGILHLKVPSFYENIILPRSISDVSAYYFLYKNTFVYPISLHNPPFYYLDGPWYLNFGAIGSVIGHEMMHGCDNIGMHGLKVNVTWFSNASVIAYQKHAVCYKDQYSVYDSSGLYKNNGTHTLRENIADSVGLNLAFEAYKTFEKTTKPHEKYKTLENYTPEQMFFIAYGTVWCSKIDSSAKKDFMSGFHSLPELRVNMAVSNSDSFALAFNCPKGSPMNPTKKCTLW